MKKIPIIIYLITIITALLLPVMAHAADNDKLIAQVELNDEYRPEYAVDIKVADKKKSADTGNAILQQIAGSLIYIAGPIAVLMIAIGGFRYVIAHGEQSQMDEAKKNITWAIIGLLIIIISYAIVDNVIQLSIPKETPAAEAPAEPDSTTPQDPA